MNVTASVVVSACLLAVAVPAGAEPAAAGPTPAAARPDAGLAVREESLLRRYRDLESSFLRLADALEATDPRRADLLRAACERAREGRLADRIETIVRLLEAGQLLKAGESQRDSLAQLREMLDLLATGGSARQRAADKDLVRQYLSRLARSIARQRDIQASTEAGRDPQELAARQGELADDTAALAGDIDGFRARSREQRAPPQDGAGRQGDGAEPDADDGDDDGDDDAARAGRSRRRLAAAEERMRRAQRRLADGAGDRPDRAAAHDAQDEAVAELEAARAELQEILRQLREDEVDRLLVQLDARLREMLATETRIRDGLGRLGDVGTGAVRQRQLEAARLGREQEGVAAAAAKALSLVREDGSAVAIPQALDQVRDDAAEAAARLARGDTTATTRALVDDIVVGLEEMLAALEKARAGKPRSGGAGGGGGDPSRLPLVDQIAELKMIRSLQLRVNGRTRRYSQLLGDGVERAEEPELRAALGRLAERQRLVERAALDIVAGRAE